jgi:hypothetical protein
VLTEEAGQHWSGGARGEWERESLRGGGGGGMRLGAVDPCGCVGGRGEHGGDFKASRARLSSEARIKLRYRAMPRGVFRVRWAVPRWA